MRFRHLAAGIAMTACLVPTVASAQIVLSAAGQAQLATLASQLVVIVTQMTQAQAQGPLYTNSPEFGKQTTVWATQLGQIQTQLATLLSTASLAPPVPPAGSTCPNLYRDLTPGMQGSDVISLQQFLTANNSAQFSGSLSGVFDAATLISVQRFQTFSGIIAYGSWDTTGYGRVGPGTRAAIASACLNSSYSTPSLVPYVPPVSTTPTNPAVPTPPAGVGYSTGQLSILTNLTGQSGGPNSVAFSVNALPNAACGSSTFTLTFGDSAQQIIVVPASCGNQVQTITHVYPNVGSYTATLTSGTFHVSVPVTVAVPNNSITISAAAGQASYSTIVTATYNPGALCSPGTYAIAFGDSIQQSISFPAGCTTQTQTVTHTYPQAAQYLITASDPSGRTVSTNFTSIVVTSAGVGDPFAVLTIHSNTGSTLTDSSVSHHPLSLQEGAVLASSDGATVIDLSPPAYITIPASPDFNFGSASFTEDLWFYPFAIPASNQQASLMIQADSSATDPSLGGSGLELFGDKLAFVGRIGGATYHPFYHNAPMSTSSIAVGQWYHAAVVRNGSTITLYLNGLAQGSITVGGSTNASSANLSLGRYGDYAGNYFDGWIDDIDIAKGTARWTSNFDADSL